MVILLKLQAKLKEDFQSSSYKVNNFGDCAISRSSSCLFLSSSSLTMTSLIPCDVIDSMSHVAPNWERVRGCLGFGTRCAPGELLLGF